MGVSAEMRFEQNKALIGIRKLFILIDHWIV
jgi:hypothetical protein